MRQAYRGGALAEMDSKAVETCGQRWCFSKALSGMRLVEALAKIGRGDGYRPAGWGTLTVEHSGWGKTFSF